MHHVRHEKIIRHLLDTSNIFATSQKMLIAFAVKTSPLPNCSSIVEAHPHANFETILT